MTPDLPAAIRALYGKGWTTSAGTPCVLVRDLERVLGEWEGEKSPETCHGCGRSPARGFAEINGKRYCHGDDDAAWPTCYMLAQLPPADGYLAHLKASMTNPAVLRAIAQTEADRAAATDEAP